MLLVELLDVLAADVLDDSLLVLALVDAVLLKLDDVVELVDAVLLELLDEVLLLEEVLALDEVLALLDVLLDDVDEELELPELEELDDDVLDVLEELVLDVEEVDGVLLVDVVLHVVAAWAALLTAAPCAGPRGALWATSLTSWPWLHTRGPPLSSLSPWSSASTLS